MNTLPKMAYVEQEFPRPKVEDFDHAIKEQLSQHKEAIGDLSGKRIGVTIGSRGITNQTKIAKALIDELKRQGADPFIFPAMGSHGGGTAEGQRKIVEDYGITEESMGVPIISSLETVVVGETELGIPVYFNLPAYEADGVIILNRIKAHTDFSGQIESGLQKMMVVGIGKINGAQNLHNNTTSYPFDELIPATAKKVIETGKILGGMALIENAYHETAEIVFVPARDIPAQEPELLKRSKSYMPSLPIESTDVLILDYIGKDISGVGMDPNITGRRYRINKHWQEKPDITRIVLMDLTPKTKGNAVGIGLADFCTQRAVDKMDKRSTYLNAITSLNTVCSNIPLHFDDDRELLQHTFKSLGNLKNGVRILHIRDTLNLTTVEVSESMIDDVKKHPNVRHVSELYDMKFDENQQLVPLEA